MKYSAVIVALVLALSPAFGQDAQEKILFYGSTINIQSDGSVSVIETITVRALSQDIKRGIYRAIPTKYKGSFFESVTIPLEVTKVMRNGAEENYFLREEDNGTAIYIGDEHQELPPGEHTYTIAYTMDRQVGSFDSYDEFYWNVTGLGWKFGIDSVYAVVNLPPDGKLISENVSAYTGASGETGCNCQVVTKSQTSVSFSTTEPLNPYEGLTVAVPFQKGLIDPPSQNVIINRLIADNYPAMIGITGLCIVLFYYIIAWLFVGRDPRGQTIVPRFEPPANLAPYELRYLNTMKFDKKAMVSCLISMAQKGYLTIDETKKGTYTLRLENESTNTPTAIEEKILRQLFGKGSSVELANTYNADFANALRELKDHLKENFSNSAFRLNRPWIVVGILASLLAAVCTIVQHPTEGMLVGVFMLVWLSGWTFGCYMIVKGFVGSIRDKKYGIGLVLLVFAVPFLAAEVFALVLLAGMMNFYALASVLLLVPVNIIFFDLMKAPTAHGRRLLDEIQGFSRFLSTAEMPRIQSLSTTPAMDLDLFQRYLPYALALDVQTQWARHFENQLTSPEQTSHIKWYKGTSFPGSLGEFSSSLNTTLSSTISSSSTPPGSGSGGSGGRGSSGGGGGGGGGGGW